MRLERAVSLVALALCALACDSKPGPQAGSQNLEAPPGSRRFIDGLSPLHMEVSATPIAQKYFDQGIRLVYAFNHDEAIRAFEAGQKLDPDCAMCWWGVALALGPNINLPMDAALNRARARGAGRRGAARAGKVTPREQAYIHALEARYSASSRREARGSRQGLRRRDARRSRRSTPTT